MTYLHNSPYQYNDDDVIEFNKINLQYEYNKVNRECFNNQLPNVPLIWTRTKSPLGRVKSVRYRLTGEKKIINLGISTFYEMTYKLFKSVMAHEMIHVKLIVNNDPVHEDLRIQHGSSFKSEMNRINNLNLGYNIEIRSTAEIPVSDSVKTKDLIVIIFLDNRNDYTISVTTPKVYKNSIESILEFFSDNVKTGRLPDTEIKAVVTDNKAFLNYPIIRTFERSIKRYKVFDKELDYLLNLNPIIHKKFSKNNLMESTSYNQENILPEIAKKVNDDYDVVINY